MGVLVFRHVPFEDLGLIAPVLESQGVEYEYADRFQASERALSLDGITGIILMGGPMSANDDLSYLRRELALIRNAVAAGKPVLGICLGAQLIAKACGANVYPNPVKEIGWFPVSKTPAGREDPLFARLRDPEMVFHWHGETFDIPAGAEWLAFSDACPHQAFRLGASVYGLQFHLEVTPGMIAGWMREPANEADVRGLRNVIDPYAHADRLREVAGAVFGRWVEFLRPQGV